MFRLLRICECAFVITAVLTTVSAQAESQPPLYAKAVQLSEIVDVLHCPSCSAARIEATSLYFVRTAEGLNVAFANDTDAWQAANLLNIMSNASGQCDKAVYQVALDEYAEITEREYTAIVQRERGGLLGWDDGTFRLLNPRGDLFSLAKYAVPPFPACQTRVAFRALRKPSHASHVKTKLARHRHGPLLSLR
jgi:hypothetical protein